MRVLAGAGPEVDTTTGNGRLVFGIFAALEQLAADALAVPAD